MLTLSQASMSPNNKHVKSGQSFEAYAAAQMQRDNSAALMSPLQAMSPTTVKSPKNADNLVISPRQSGANLQDFNATLQATSSAMITQNQSLAPQTVFKKKKNSKNDGLNFKTVKNKYESEFKKRVALSNQQVKTKKCGGYVQII